MNKRYHWDSREIEYSPRWNSLIDVHNNEAYIPAYVCDAIRYMAAFRVNHMIIMNQDEITEVE